MDIIFSAVNQYIQRLFKLHTMSARTNLYFCQKLTINNRRFFFISTHIHCIYPRCNESSTSLQFKLKLVRGGYPQNTKQLSAHIREEPDRSVSPTTMELCKVWGTRTYSHHLSIPQLHLQYSGFSLKLTVQSPKLVTRKMKVEEKSNLYNVSLIKVNRVPPRELFYTPFVLGDSS